MKLQPWSTHASLLPQSLSALQSTQTPSALLHTWLVALQATSLSQGAAGTQALALQRLALPQSLETTQATQVWACTSQTPCTQSAFEPHGALSSPQPATPAWLHSPLSTSHASLVHGSPSEQSLVPLQQPGPPGQPLVSTFVTSSPAVSAGGASLVATPSDSPLPSGRSPASVATASVTASPPACGTNPPVPTPPADESVHPDANATTTPKAASGARLRSAALARPTKPATRPATRPAMSPVRRGLVMTSSRAGPSRARRRAHEWDAGPQPPEGRAWPSAGL